MTDTICPGQLRSFGPDRDGPYMRNPQYDEHILVLRRHPCFEGSIEPVWEIYNITSGRTSPVHEVTLLRNSDLVEVAQ